MILKIKHYGFHLKKKELCVWSKWEETTYRMKFKVTRWNPFTYIYPFFVLFWRKLLPRTFIKYYPNQPWNLCGFCEKVATFDIAGIPACEDCKKQYD